MRRFLIVFVSALLAIPVGGGAGLLLGLGFIKLFNVSCFEGYCGYVAAFDFPVLGAFIAFIAAIIVSLMMTRRPPAST